MKLINECEMKKIYLLTLLFTLEVLTTGNICSQMFWNYACKFEGNNSSYLAIASSSILNEIIDRGIFTVECWVCPMLQPPNTRVLIQKGDGNNPVGFCLYLDQGKVALKLNNVTKITGSNFVANDKWTHIAASYNKTTAAVKLYINGSLDAQGFALNSWTTPNIDSLFIAKGSEPAFFGMMDDIRIWDSERPASEISRNYRTTLATMVGSSPNGVYTGLVLSLPFQTSSYSGIIFSRSDWSLNGHTAFNRGASGVNLTKRPYNNIAINESFNVKNGYISSPANNNNTPLNALTLECWVYLNENISSYQAFVRKGVGLWGVTNFSIEKSIMDTYMGVINGSFFFTNITVKINEWEHLAITYNAVNGLYKFYFNGEVADTRNLNPASLNSNGDSLYIGNGLVNGYIDEIRISHYVKSQEEIKKSMFHSIDLSNNPNTSQPSLCYNADGYSVPNDIPILSNTQLYFRWGARYSNSAALDNIPVSPLNRSNELNFTDGWFYKRVFDYNSQPNVYKKIPQSYSLYISEDTMNISSGSTISDINFFIGLNHNNDQDLQINLYSPDGDSVNVYSNNNQMALNDNIVTIFDDNADSLLLDNRYVSYGPSIKPLNSINTKFAGKQSQGVWKVRIYDINPLSDTGIFYTWGLQINNLTQIVKQNEDNPSEFSLSQNYPNPFNPVTHIKFTIPQAGTVTLKIYNMLGEEMTTIINQTLNRGFYTADWDGSEYSSGVYFYKLIVDSYSETKKMILIK